MDNKRPQGREKNVSGTGSGLHRRGEGLNTGPVGSTGTPGNGSRPQGGGSSGGSQGPVRSGGSKSPILIIIVAVIAIFFGSKFGLLDGLLGGGDTGTETEAATNAGTNTGTNTGTNSGIAALLAPYGITASSSNTASSSAGTGITQSLLQSLTSSVSSAGWTAEPNTEAQPDTTVAAGSRAKYTTVQGGGKDEITIMVYMCGTDLESKSGMATRDIMEMTQASLSDKVHVIIYTGGCKKWNNSIISATQNQIYEVASGGIRCLEENMGKASMTKPETLTTFIQWCTAHYPANRQMLIFWDHGGGSVSGYGYDEKNASGGSMTLAGIRQALSAAGTKFDIIGFDACLMATVETALMLDDYADYMIASEETEPGIGWYYTNWLTKLSANTSMATTDLGRLIVDDFVNTCASSCRGQSATLSVIDIAQLAHTVPDSLKDFSQSLSSMISSNEYKQISDARNGTREFARSSKIDQIDLVHFAKNLGTAEGNALAEALLGAVKYNRTSSDINNAYGISIFFPYRKTSTVDQAVRTYDAIGMDESYSEAIRAFASLEVSGQATTGGTNSALSSLLGGALGSSSGSSDMIGSLLSSFLGGGFGTIEGLTSGNTSFLSGRALSDADTVSYIADNYFDPNALVWSMNADGAWVIALPESQWALVEGLELNVFYDDGEGYIDLGLDNVFSFDENGNLEAPNERTWVAVNGQTVAYYHEYTVGEGKDAVTFGRIPAMLNGERVDLLVAFENGGGRITGARAVYAESETDTVAKSVTEIEVGDTIDFLCDYYTYEGEYENSYLLGEQMQVTGELRVTDAVIEDGGLRVAYRFTDIFQQHYWSAPLKG